MLLQIHRRALASQRPPNALTMPLAQSLELEPETTKVVERAGGSLALRKVARVALGLGNFRQFGEVALKREKLQVIFAYEIEGGNTHWVLLLVTGLAQ